LKPAANLYRSAASLELLHDFLLVHDDIIDKSDSRRGKPAMHVLLNKCLRKSRNIKFSGTDLAIVAGDVIFAMALHAFLSVKVNAQRKESAFKKLIEAALYTGSGEFIELVLNLKPIERITKEDIYKIYDLKTANYTFSTPLVMGAALAGADVRELKRLHNYGIYLGRAFQIHDDILGIFGSPRETGKPNLTDLQEAKKTLLIWRAHQESCGRIKQVIKKILAKEKVNAGDLAIMRKIIRDSGSLACAKKEIAALAAKAGASLAASRINLKYKKPLRKYTESVLGL
jgi:geranylgeranyl diphosphate synthase type I